MPFALPLALLVSLGLHLLLLLGPGLEWSVETETEAKSSLLRAELRPVAVAPNPAPPPVVEERPAPADRAPVAKPVTRKNTKPKNQPVKQAAPTPVLSLPATDASLPTIAESVAVDRPPDPVVDSVLAPEAVPPEMPAGELVNAPTTPWLPANGAIDYRVDRGDSNFAIGVARHQWEIDGDHYRLTSMVQSTGIVRLFKDFRVEMESRGTITADGLRPDFFVLRRNDKPAWEKAFFDWQRMKVRVGGNPDQDLDAGAQDFLSFNYQLGFLPRSGAGTVLPIASGRKYSLYSLESLGDEEIDLPVGRLRTLHLRAPGDNTTELWLAYEYQLLPVKIRHVDSKGDSLVQVATHIQMSSP